MIHPFRGRPRTVSADSDGKVPKKRKRKRQTKFVDDDNDMLSDLSNNEDEAIEDTNRISGIASVQTTVRIQKWANSDQKWINQGQK